MAGISELVIELEREVIFLRAENQRLRNYIHEHGLTIGLIPRVKLAYRSGVNGENQETKAEGKEKAAPES